MQRRHFLAAALAAAPALRAASPRLPITKAVEFSMLPTSMSVLERFQLAKDAGFAQIECPTMPEQKDADEAKTASEKTGLRIHSVMNMDHWKYPLNSPDPEVYRLSRQGMETSLRNAHFWGADTVLLVPAVVDKSTSYRDAYTVSQQRIRQMIPLAKDLKVVIAVEEVWNKFLLSPIEFAKYIDDFQSPWVKAYFDVGNVALFSFPHDWIRILGPRIAKLHIKDFSFRKRQAEFPDLRDGDIDFHAIYQALADIGYKGSATLELRNGDAAFIQEMSRRFDAILTNS